MYVTDIAECENDIDDPPSNQSKVSSISFINGKTVGLEMSLVEKETPIFEIFDPLKSSVVSVS